MYNSKVTKMSSHDIIPELESLLDNFIKFENAVKSNYDICLGSIYIVGLLIDEYLAFIKTFRSKYMAGDNFRPMVLRYFARRSYSNMFLLDDYERQKILFVSRWRKHFYRQAQSLILPLMDAGTSRFTESELRIAAIINLPLLNIKGILE